MNASELAIDPPFFPERFLTGFQPTGTMHLGNWMGALQPCLRFQDLHPGECFILIADLHLLTSRPDRSSIQASISNTARSFLALGIEPNKCVIYLQSEVPQTCELMWALSCYVGSSLLHRGHAYQSALRQGQAPSVGLLLYPLLQGADILSLRATQVAAGPDQRQHIELARDVARRMNALSELAVFPEPTLAIPNVRAVVGTDGKRRMSLANGNYISIFEDELVVSDQINSIVSLPLPQGTPVQPDAVPAFGLLQLLAPADISEDARTGLAAGKLSMNDLKNTLTKNFLTYFAEARERYVDLGRETVLIKDIIAQGSIRARDEAADAILAVRDLIGY